MRVLGIESSCDETAAAIVENGTKLISDVVSSSADLFSLTGGVIPEIAARSHIEVITAVVNQALVGAKLKWKDIDAIAVTYGAGLGGSLLIGVLTARTLAIINKKPLYAINHVEGHVYANFINHQITDTTGRRERPFPLMALIVSGGHSQLVLFNNHFDYRLLGQTQDDAIGEAFDKVAKMLGLPYPGGPSISNMAKTGNPLAYKLPKAKLEGKYDFSFSGLKTAVLRLAQSEIGESFNFPSEKLSSRLNMAQKADIAAIFQRTAIDTVVSKTFMAYSEYKPKSVVIAGGVAANAELRRQLSDALPIKIDYPDPSLCTDNGAMIAALGCFKLKYKKALADPYSLNIAPDLSM